MHHLLSVAVEARLLHMQMYMTSALSMHDMKGFALQVAIDAMQRKGQRSLVTGLRSQFKAGRPDWNQASDKTEVILMCEQCDNCRWDKTTACFTH